MYTFVHLDGRVGHEIEQNRFETQPDKIHEISRIIIKRPTYQ